MVKIAVDDAKCIREKEKMCVELCPTSVFRYRPSEKPLVAHAENCIMCRTCQVNCPSQAIDITT